MNTPQDGDLPKTLEDLTKYIQEFRSKIAVREQVNGKWGSYFLSELTPNQERKHTERFISEGRIPVRVT